MIQLDQSNADNRPVWNFSNMKESDFRTIWEFGVIKSVKSDWAYTSADTSDEWLEVSNGKKAIRLPRNWSIAISFVGYASGPGLFQLTYEGRRMADRVEEIDKWEAKNARERREYERLKAKFETQPKETP